MNNDEGTMNKHYVHEGIDDEDEKRMPSGWWIGMVLYLVLFMALGFFLGRCSV